MKRDIRDNGRWHFVSAFMVGAYVNAQTVTPLSFEPAGSAYSSALDRIIFISGSPDLLHIYNPASNADVTVALPDAPVNFSVSPDGLHAAIEHPFSISYVNLQTQAVEKTLAADVGTSGRVVLGPDYLYVFNAPAGIFVYQLSDRNFKRFRTKLLWQRRLQFRYSKYLNLLRLCNHKVRCIHRPNKGANLWPVSLTTGYCGQIWYSLDNTRVYDDAGTVLHASTDANVDMTYESTLPAGGSSILALASSAAANKIGVVVSGLSGSDGFVQLYDYDSMSPNGRITLPSFSSGGTSYAAHGKNLFFNSAGSFLYVLMEADQPSGLLNDQAIFAVPLKKISSCAVALDATNISAAGTGGIYSTSVTADSVCEYQATANVDWIVFSSGNFGSGNGTLTYQVRANSGAARSGVISIGSATLNVTQSAASTPADLNPLSFNVLAADYSQSLDRIVMVASLPNELHIYDRLTQNDQIVELPAIPLCVSVSPDGTHAAVGHDGSVSYINLQTGVVQNSFPISETVTSVALAGNGYIYAMPGYLYTSTFYAISSATGTIAPVTTEAIFGQFKWAQLSPSGTLSISKYGEVRHIKWRSCRYRHN